MQDKRIVQQLSKAVEVNAVDVCICGLDLILLCVYPVPLTAIEDQFLIKINCVTLSSLLQKSKTDCTAGPASLQLSLSV